MIWRQLALLTALCALVAAVPAAYLAHRGAGRCPDCGFIAVKYSHSTNPDADLLGSCVLCGKHFNPKRPR